MLAPMQGLTNSALRRLYLQKYQPDLVFTEFVRVQAQTRKRVAKNELSDMQDHSAVAPLVVQLIGNDPEALADAALLLQAQGIQHINLNLGCPYGRMTTGATGGELLRQPQRLALMLKALRRVCRGSFSVKCRAGYEDLLQWQSLLPLFEESAVDFIVLHPRTVAQRYNGTADHRISAAMAAATSLPVIANGDINSPQAARTLLTRTGVAGLMIGRGALADPMIFQRIRGTAPLEVDPAQRRRDLGLFIGDLWPDYLQKFCGERQALMKIKDVLNFIPDVDLQRDLGKLKRTTSGAAFLARLQHTFPV
ncbi:tRNA-dihydrouridine synthase family protein [Pelobacter sp. M08fum]|uniref:tRNA-dihydrouridine synthase n=2 Tax=Pelovirga terrestris TaxID=2771352 RepID=A0A8J6QQG3_9BACT|nr:tRNA-dihydrouridine synthase family protein [Pelovirga terrestris]MBD1401186.1 tRNA-dihydrouridine synthase family protein [Pelovirga terrestris]